MNSIADLFKNKEKYHEHPEWISKHLNQYFEEKDIKVFHEILSLDFHLDVYLINDPKRNYQILLTSGMSLMEMNIDVETDLKDELRFGELMLLIPKELEFDLVHTGEKPNDWIISMIKQTAKFPHYYNTWLGEGHTVQANEEYQPYSDNTEFHGIILLPSATFDEEFMKIEKDGRVINIHSLFPLYKNELEYKREKGFSAFWESLVASNPKEILNLNRPNIFQKKRFWNK